MLKDIYAKIEKAVLGLAGDYGAALAADYTRDWLKTKGGSRVKDLVAADNLALQGKHQEAYNKLLTMFRNSGDRDEEVLLQDSLTIYRQHKKFKVKLRDVISWYYFVGKLPDPVKNKFRHAHMTELDENAKLYKLAALIKLGKNKDRAAALRQSGFMSKTQIDKLLESIIEWDARLVPANKKLDREYRAIRRDITRANKERRNRGFLRTLWDIVRPRPFM